MTPAPSVVDPVFAAQVSIRDAREVLIPLLQRDRPGSRRAVVSALLALSEAREALDDA